MGGALNTQVNGNPETLWRAAEYLRRTAEGAQQAAGLVRQAGSTADAGWDGPARDAFAMSTNQFSPDLAELSGIAGRYDRATQELGDTLATVIKRMQGAVDQATAGGLRVEGTVHHRPRPACRTCDAAHRAVWHRQGHPGHGAEPGFPPGPQRRGRRVQR